MKAGTDDVAVGMIGVGALGLALAERLIAAGFAVHGYRRGGLDAFTAIGGTAMTSAAATAADADPLILLLPNDGALSQVMTDIASSLRRGQTILCLGTHRSPAKQAAADAAHAVGAVLLDGEVSGTPAMARAGQASVMIAGDAAAAERALPVLKAFACATKHVGDFGAATRMKLVTNYLVGVHTLAAAEALTLAQRLGLDPRMVVDALAPSAGGSTMLSVRGRMMAERNFEGGSMSGFVRFFELLRDALAESNAQGGPLLDLTERLYRHAIASGHGDRDIAAICDSLAEAS